MPSRYILFFLVRVVWAFILALVLHSVAYAAEETPSPPNLFETLGKLFSGKTANTGTPSSPPVDPVSPTIQGTRNLAVTQTNRPRFALVIGNAAYKSGPLNNPVNDAQAMAQRLRELNFDVVLRENLKTREIGSVYREFRSKIVPGGVALVFYAGHGVQFKGENFFPAVDADILSEEDVPLQSLNLSSLLGNMEEAKAGVSLVFLDACRDNPFARRFRSGSRGLAKVEAASGTLIHYATRPGSVAEDGEGKNGTYTEALLAQMSEPDVPVELMLKRVANRVVDKTKGKQEPWGEGSLRGDFYFVFQGPATVNLQQAPLDPETEAWRAAERIDTLSAYQTYLDAYPRGHYAVGAKIRIDALNKPTQPPPSAPQPTTVPPAPMVTPTESTWHPIRAALASFAGDLAGAKTVNLVVRADLERTGLFQIVDTADTTMDENARPKYADWKANGIDALAVGSISVRSDGRYETRFRLHDTQKQIAIGGKAFTHAANQIRPTAHLVADYIYEKLTGQRGMFSTRVAYVVHGADRYELQIADVDGNNPQVALSSREPINSPAWSPDGSLLAYVSNESKQPSVFVHELKSGKRKMVVSLDGAVSANIAWSGDGAMLAILANLGNATTAFYSVTPTGNDKRLLFSSPSEDTSPSFSQDGQHLYFASNSSGLRRIYRMPVKGGGPEKITVDSKECFAPAVSPDGKYLAYIAKAGSTNRIVLMELGSSYTSILGDAPLAHKLNFSADSQLIMFQGKSGYGSALMAASVKKRDTRVWMAMPTTDAYSDFSFGPYIR